MLKIYGVILGTGNVEPKIAEMFGVAEPVAGDGSAVLEIGHG